ncbi:uridine kinase family protein [Demequina sp. SO4-18]|uniref:uridine kinase family protein n=1 Tax=Demequina sp. SO4-18 TaxID=3401026 RepID=UPI003B59994B
MSPQQVPPVAASVAEIAMRARAAAPALGPTRLVLIDGPAGSGKTTLAARLAQALEREPAAGAPSASVHVLHADDMYEGWDGLPSLDATLIDRVLAPIARGDAGRFRVWDWHRGQRAHEVEVPASDVLIVEGVGVAMRPARAYATLVVWVEAAPAERLRRGLARDGEEVRDEWLRWQSVEQAHFAREQTLLHADLRVDGDHPLDP